MLLNANKQNNEGGPADFLHAAEISSLFLDETVWRLFLFSPKCRLIFNLEEEVSLKQGQGNMREELF